MNDRTMIIRRLTADVNRTVTVCYAPRHIFLHLPTRPPASSLAEITGILQASQVRWQESFAWLRTASRRIQISAIQRWRTKLFSQ